MISVKFCIGWMDKWKQRSGPTNQVRQGAILDVLSIRIRGSNPVESETRSL